MKKYFLDTSVIASCLRGKEVIINKVRKLEGEICSSLVCLAELYEGVFRVKELEKEEMAVLTFFDGLDDVYGLSQEIARNFGKVRSELKRKGTVIEDLDILIAATCIANNLTLVTANPKHFLRIKELEIIEPRGVVSGTLRRCR